MNLNLYSVPTLKDMETFLIILAMLITKGNKTKAAKLLGVSARTIRTKINNILNNNKLIINVNRKNNNNILNGTPYYNLEAMLDNNLWELYWGFYNKINEVMSLGNKFIQLIKLDGKERAKLLRKDKKLREYYTMKTQRV